VALLDMALFGWLVFGSAGEGRRASAVPAE
jgi:hypothetical protein